MKFPLSIQVVAPHVWTLRDADSEAICDGAPDVIEAIRVALERNADGLDYKYLLKKYMDHVVEEEGISFISEHMKDSLHDEDITYRPFTEQEIDILLDIQEAQVQLRQQARMQHGLQRI